MEQLHFMKCTSGDVAAASFMYLLNKSSSKKIWKLIQFIRIKKQKFFFSKDQLVVKPTHTRNGCVWILNACTITEKKTKRKKQHDRNRRHYNGPQSSCSMYLNYDVENIEANR